MLLLLLLAASSGSPTPLPAPPDDAAGCVDLVERFCVQHELCVTRREP